MTNKYNIHIGRAGILNLISQREQGVLLNQFYKNSVTNVKVNQLPKFSGRSTIYTDADDGFYWRFLRNGSRGDLVGVGWDCNGAIRRRHSSVCVFQFMTHGTPSEKNASIDTLPFINEISKNYNILPDLLIIDTADLSYRNQKPLLIVGQFKSVGNAAILTSYHCDYVHQEYEWRVDDHIFCCASQLNSENFVLGCSNGFYICKNLKLSKKYRLEDHVIAAEFNDDGNLLFISGNQNGIQLCDMRENLERSRRNFPPYIKEPALNDSSLIASRMKLLTDQVTLIVSGKTGHISKIDLRVRKPVFQYSEHRTFQSCRPLNIDEDLDLLCAVGNDNCCRIWSLSSGKLHWTNKIAATNYRGGPLTAHACIVSSERRWFVAVVQNDTVTPIVPDETEMVAFQPDTVTPIVPDETEMVAFQPDTVTPIVPDETEMVAFQPDTVTPIVPDETEMVAFQPDTVTPIVPDETEMVAFQPDTVTPIVPDETEMVAFQPDTVTPIVPDETEMVAFQPDTVTPIVPDETEMVAFQPDTVTPIVPDETEMVAFQPDTVTPIVPDETEMVAFQPDTVTPIVPDETEMVAFQPDTVTPIVPDETEMVAFQPDTVTPIVPDETEMVAFQPDTVTPIVPDETEMVAFQPDTVTPIVPDETEMVAFQPDTVTPIVPDETEMVAFQPDTVLPSGL